MSAHDSMSRLPAKGERPRPPLQVIEYGDTITPAQARKMFRGTKQLGKAWGMLHAHDAAGSRWTLLGDLSYAEGLIAVSRPDAEATERQEPTRSPGGPAPGGRSVSGAIWAEFPIEAFAPRWCLSGWPDDWPHLGALDVYPFPTSIEADDA